MTIYIFKQNITPEFHKILGIMSEFWWHSAHSFCRIVTEQIELQPKTLFLPHKYRFWCHISYAPFNLSSVNMPLLKGDINTSIYQ